MFVSIGNFPHRVTDGQTCESTGKNNYRVDLLHRKTPNKKWWEEKCVSSYYIK